MLRKGQQHQRISDRQAHDISAYTASADPSLQFALLGQAKCAALMFTKPPKCCRVPFCELTTSHALVGCAYFVKLPSQQTVGRAEGSPSKSWGLPVVCIAAFPLCTPCFCCTPLERSLGLLRPNVCKTSPARMLSESPPAHHCYSWS